MQESDVLTMNLPNATARSDTFTLTMRYTVLEDAAANMYGAPFDSAVRARRSPPTPVAPFAPVLVGWLFLGPRPPENQTRAASGRPGDGVSIFLIFIPFSADTLACYPKRFSMVPGRATERHY